MMVVLMNMNHFFADVDGWTETQKQNNENRANREKDISGPELDLLCEVCVLFKMRQATEHINMTGENTHSSVTPLKMLLG